MQQCYGGSDDEEQLINILEIETGYFVLGSTDSKDGDVSTNHGGTDIWLVSVDSVGTILWERSYGGTGEENAMDIIEDSNGFYYISGWTSSNDGDIQSGNHGAWDRWIIKIDDQGEIIWEKCYGGSYKDYPCKLLLLADGNILSYGATVSNDGDVPVNYGYLDVWLTVINSDGDIVENNVYGNIDQNNIFSIVQTNDGGFFFTSNTDSNNGMVNGELKGGTDIWAVKLDSSFNIEWQKLYGGTNEDYQGNGLLLLNDGYFFIGNTISDDGDVTGFHGIPGEIDTKDIWAVKIDFDGNIIWEKCIGGSKRDYGTNVLENSQGGFTIVSETNSKDGDIEYNNSWDNYYDIWVAELSNNGEIVYSECYGGLRSEHIYPGGVIEKAHNNYLLGGLSEYATGDVTCNIKGFFDIWMFEVKDCEMYNPSKPEKPFGMDTLCVNTHNVVNYQIPPSYNSWSYEWNLDPIEAGIANGDSTEVTVQWNSLYEGQAELMARGVNNCGYGEWSTKLSIQTFNCLGDEEFESSGIEINVYPNPSKSEIFINMPNEIQHGTIQFLDINEQVLYEDNDFFGEKIYLADFKDGIYLLKYSKLNFMFTTKIIIIK